MLGCCGDDVHLEDVLDCAANAAVMYSYVPLAHHMLDPAVFHAPCQYRKQVELLSVVLYRVFISCFLISLNVFFHHLCF